VNNTDVCLAGNHRVIKQSDHTVYETENSVIRPLPLKQWLLIRNPEDQCQSIMAASTDDAVCIRVSGHFLLEHLSSSYLPDRTTVRSDTEIGLLSLLLSVSQGASSACTSVPHRKGDSMRAWESLLLTPGPKTDT